MKYYHQVKSNLFPSKMIKLDGINKKHKSQVLEHQDRFLNLDKDEVNHQIEQYLKKYMMVEMKDL